MYLDKKKEISTKIKLKMWLFSILEQKSVKNNCNFTKIFLSGQSVEYYKNFPNRTICRRTNWGIQLYSGRIWAYQKVLDFQRTHSVRTSSLFFKTFVTTVSNPIWLHTLFSIFWPNVTKFLNVTKISIYKIMRF